MDIQRLLKKRQLNVQEQNALDAYRLERCALAWRNEGVPVALMECARARGVDWAATVVLQLEVDFPGMSSLFGLLLTQDERFIEFEIDTDPAHQRVESLECWQDVSDTLNHSTRNRGTGQGFAAIAKQVRRRVLGSLAQGCPAPGTPSGRQTS